MVVLLFVEVLLATLAVFALGLGATYLLSVGSRAPIERAHAAQLIQDWELQLLLLDAEARRHARLRPPPNIAEALSRQPR